MNTDNYTLSECHLKVSDRHALYIQEWGNPAGPAFIHLHGGPGSGTTDFAKSNYDPMRDHVIFYDQRGAGLSTPAGETLENTTDLLVADLEQIFRKFSIKSATIVGRSWGSTLALVFAIRHPELVKALIIGGVFLADQKSTDLLMKGNFRENFPDVWEKFMKNVSEDFRENPAQYYFNQIEDGNEYERLEAIDRLHRMESSVVSLFSEPSVSETNLLSADLSGAKIESFFIAHACFLEPDYIMNHASEILARTWIIQGRYDFVCPGSTAYSLAKNLPNLANFIWTVAGHSGSDHENLQATRLAVREASRQ